MSCWSSSITCPTRNRLYSGQTVIQYLHDSHCEGVEATPNYVRQWWKLQGLIDERRYIPDETRRAGKHPNRMEVESMQLEGYTWVAVNPWEAVSGGILVSCVISRRSARSVFKGSPGRHEVRIRYFDQYNGPASFRVLLSGQLLDEWVASGGLPAQKIGGRSSSLILVPGVALKLGDEIRIEGSPDGREPAALDYLEIQ